MDAIDRAIKKGLHISKIEELRDQSWQMFEEDLAGKKLFLFGIGKGLEWFDENYGSKVVVTGVIDNNERKHRKLLSDECSVSNIKDLYIEGVEALSDFKPEELIILICSIQYYEDIAQQLKKIDINAIYSLLTMEANVRKSIEYEEKDYKLEFSVQQCQNPIINNKLVFVMGNYCGHGFYISQEILKRNDNLEIVWIVSSILESSLSSVRQVLISDWQAFSYELETARIWICDILIPKYILKREGQVYIQVKHWSSVTLKKFGLGDFLACKSKETVDHCYYNRDIMDYIFVGSDFDKETCRMCYDYTKEFIHVGSARTDILFKKEIKTQLKELLNISMDLNLLMYAPTFRSNEFNISKVAEVEMDFDYLKDMLEKRFGGAWKVLLRLHPAVSMESYKVKKTDAVIDVSFYENVQELVALSDVVITDYSSIMFEPAFVKKPVFLFAPDRKEYIDGERELLIPYDELPFLIAETNEELAKNIAAFNQEEYEIRITQFLDKYGVHEDGHASERAADFILGLLEKE